MKLSMKKIVRSSLTSQKFNVYRQTGDFVAGGFSSLGEVKIPMVGTVRPTSSRDIETLPEGDRSTESMTFWTDQVIHVTHAAGVKGTSDQIEYQGSRYRVVQSKNNQDSGYTKAIGLRMAGD